MIQKYKLKIYTLSFAEVTFSRQEHENKIGKNNNVFGSLVTHFSIYLYLCVAAVKTSSRFHSLRYVVDALCFDDWIQDAIRIALLYRRKCRTIPVSNIWAISDVMQQHRTIIHYIYAFRFHFL